MYGPAKVSTWVQRTRERAGAGGLVPVNKPTTLQRRTTTRTPSRCAPSRSDDPKAGFLATRQQKPGGGGVVRRPAVVRKPNIHDVNVKSPVSLTGASVPVITMVTEASRKRSSMSPKPGSFGDDARTGLAPDVLSDSGSIPDGSNGLIVQRLGHRPFTPATRVRFPLRSPTLRCFAPENGLRSLTAPDELHVRRRQQRRVFGVMVQRENVGFASLRSGFDSP